MSTALGMPMVKFTFPLGAVIVKYGYNLVYIILDVN